MQNYQLFNTTSTIIELQILLLCVQLTYLSSPKIYIKLHLRNYYGNSLYMNTSPYNHPKDTLSQSHEISYASIENAYCYQLPSTVAQFIRNIWSTYNITHRSKSLLTLTQTQYSLKVKRQHNEIIWWNHDYLITLYYDSPEVMFNV